LRTAGQATRASIKDSTHPAWARQERKLRKMKDTEFVRFDAADGAWQFIVPHFTQCGLDDEGDDSENASEPAAEVENMPDSEEDDEPDFDAMEEDHSVNVGREHLSMAPDRSSRSRSLAPRSPSSSASHPIHESSTPFTSHKRARREPQPNRPWSESLGLDPHKVHAMQASMFGSAEPLPPLIETRRRSKRLQESVLSSQYGFIRAAPTEVSRL